MAGQSEARALTEQLGGAWRGDYGTAACPVCQPERRADQVALVVSTGNGGRLLLHCHKTGCGFRDILAAARRGTVRPGTHGEGPSGKGREVTARQKSDIAFRLWRDAIPIPGTPAEAYIRGRAITCDLPPTLRFHPACSHPCGQRLPAMLALIEGVDDFGVHRTFLRNDGRGKATVTPDKAMLGAAAGGGVRLSEGGSTLAVAEGVETALSLASGLLPGPVTVWAALSSGGMRGLRLPARAGRLIVATDGDEPGRAAGHSLTERAAALGWAVSLLPAPDGRDWADVLALGARR